MNELTDKEKILNDEVFFMRREIANDWHLNNIKRLDDKYIEITKQVFYALPVECRKGGLSIDILWKIYKDVQRE